MKTLLIRLGLFLSCNGSLVAQLTDAPVDLFERVQWGATIAQIRSMSTDATMELMRSVRTKEVVEKNGLIFFIRREVAFGETLRVMYAIRSTDSTLHRVLINVVEFAGLPGQTRGRHDSVWLRIKQRYGPASLANGSGPDRRIWTSSTSTVEVFHFDGPASGVTLIARPHGEKR
ncbi:MAG: hypothetical protein MUE68_03955 [Bacteroidetes bacterium]|jgi:hypothetical protein|nr:hypothetical protein [Bacteroidota bacterium]